MGFDFAVLVDQMKIIATLMIIGVIWQKLKLFDNNLINSLSSIISKLILPLMLCTLIGSVSATELLGSYKIFIICFVFYSTVVIIAKIASMFRKSKDDKKKMDILLQCYCNTGFIGVPLLVSLFGDSSAIIAASYTLVEIFFYWVIGPLILGDRDKVNLKKLINPIMISVVLGIIIIFLPVNLNGNIVWETAKNVGGTCKYFSSIYIGMAVARMDISKIKDNIKSAFNAPVKLLISPLFAYFLFGATGILKGDTLIMFIILCSTPAGMMLPIVAEVSESDTIEYSSVGLLFSTVLSLVTLPLVVWFTSVI